MEFIPTSKSLTPEISTRTTTTTSIDKDEETSEFEFKLFLGLVGTVIALVLIIIAIERVWRWWKDYLAMERNNEHYVSMPEITPDIMNQPRDPSQQIPIEAPAEVPNSGAEEVVVVDNETYLDQMEIDRNWEIPRERLEILETKLGGGDFGVVKKGNYLRGDGNKLPVAVKMLKDTNDQKQRMVLIQELEMLKKVGRHKNIVNLVGACSFEEPLCVIIEFVPDGSLDRILLESRIPARTEDANYANLWSRLSERDLLRIAKDVANGMQHLESKLCVHRDLAARNILIGKGLVAKVADFGLSRDISQNGEYIKCTGVHICHFIFVSRLWG
ncbi:macrophage colony-stimulating factor 1 receptor-like isoform X3 [Stylophora pistillata]|uniref:macrophage colony-stimulating factor 1 receptor-like isoform X3 n=1 Tax=Stylophora pistillata TaxID=50429 RepID=UPI000C04E6DA|nr:macrophage colony-stimulating factor 1 receptor-like isoform X3 [Stylophora pistillata]